MKTLSARLITAVACLWCTLHTAAVKSSSYLFDDSVGLGRHFDGIGGLSGGGATSKLLVNYPQKQRDEILDYLFKPNFGASLQVLKVEIGSDAQSTEGSEASHMHNSWDENYERGYEWWLMLEAKKRNPNIKLYCLPWGFPGWIGQGTRSPYTNPTVTADYVIRWINGAKVHYNLTIDFVGIWNEEPYNITYIKTLRKMLDSRGFSNVRIVASDGKSDGWGIALDINKDPELAAAIDYIGCHYPGTVTTEDALKTGKQLWSTEDYSTFNDEVGGGCWARIVNRNYALGNITSTIAWSLIVSFYNSLQFYGNGLMTAAEPWSGNYNVETPIWLSAHTTQFTEIGWKYLKHGSGVGILDGGGSYVALVSPDGNDLTIVVETMSHDHSVCIRPPLPPYNVTPQVMDIQLKAKFSTITEMNVWYSKLGFNGQSTVMFEKKDPIKFTNGAATLSLALDEVYTLTTRTDGQKGQYSAPPPSKPFPLPYTDNFESYALSEEPYNLAQQTGSYEVVAGDSAHGQVVRQMVLEMVCLWCPGDAVNKSTNLIGDVNWTDIYVEVEARLGAVNGTDGVFVAARVQEAGCQSQAAAGIFFFLFPDSNAWQWQVTTDLVRTQVVLEGSTTAVHSKGWNTLSLLVKGPKIEGAVNGQTVFSNLLNKKAPNNGFVAIGTDTYGIADFDNLKITSASEGQRIMRNNERLKGQDTLYFEPENQ